MTDSGGRREGEREDTEIDTASAGSFLNSQGCARHKPGSQKLPPSFPY